MRAYALALQERLAAEKEAHEDEKKAHAATRAALEMAKQSIKLNALQIEKLKAQLAKLRRMKFGQSSEKLRELMEQLELSLEDMETAQALDESRVAASEPNELEDPLEETKAKPKREPLPAALPREDILCPAPDSELAVTAVAIRAYSVKI
ncbi:hypothetical protein GCM10009096_07140 [Parasphingorhabdus litoris]|uniref:Transposase TnpC homeodomain domain-containing protein n=1 Tax=Parasphingorhabdus litoris TaxID=394733 RepID=A0ABN1A6J4_9SPHN